MPYFENPQNVHIERSEILDLKGNYTHDDHSSHITNTNSGNTITHNVTDSYNNSSKRRLRNRNTYNTFEDGRKYHTVMAGTVDKAGQLYPPGVGMGFDRTHSASDRWDTLDHESKVRQDRYLPQRDYDPELESESESDLGEEPSTRPLKPPHTRPRTRTGPSRLTSHNLTSKPLGFKSNNPYAKLIDQPESTTSSQPSNQNLEHYGNCGPPPAPGRYY